MYETNTKMLPIAFILIKPPSHRRYMKDPLLVFTSSLKAYKNNIHNVTYSIVLLICPLHTNTHTLYHINNKGEKLLCDSIINEKEITQCESKFQVYSSSASCDQNILFLYFKNNLYRVSLLIHNFDFP